MENKKRGKNEKYKEIYQYFKYTKCCIYITTNINKKFNETYKRIKSHGK